MSEAFEKLVHIPADNVHIEGMLELPEDAQGLVLFAHGSGSSRHSPRVITILPRYCALAALVHC